MGCLSKAARQLFVWGLSLLQIAIGIYILYSVIKDLYKVTIETADGGATTSETCFLETEVSTLNLCRLTIGAVSFTFVVSMVLSIIQCFTCNCCGLGWIFDTLLAMVLAVVWAVLAVYLRDADDQLDSRTDPYAWDTDSVDNKRTAVVWLSFVEAGLYALSGIVGLSMMCPESEDRYKN